MSDNDNDNVVEFTPKRLGPEALAERDHMSWVKKIREKHPNMTTEQLLQHLGQRLLALHVRTLEMAFEGVPVDDRVTRKAVYDLHIFLNNRSTPVEDLRIMYSVMHVLKNRDFYL